MDESGQRLARANPLRVVKAAPTLRRYWADLHGQSGETIGMGTAEEYFRYARDKAFIDMVGHQGNDFQITDAFWRELNELTAKFDEPGRFVCLPGYEWSGNTGMGGDRNIFFRHEGRPSAALRISLSRGRPRLQRSTPHDELFECHQGRGCRRHRPCRRALCGHQVWRMTDASSARVEVHSSWGTFEWLLHDAFDMGYRVGVVCHSDDHKGRPGATHPGASTFGAIGGLPATSCRS